MERHPFCEPCTQHPPPVHGKCRQQVEGKENNIEDAQIPENKDQYTSDRWVRCNGGYCIHKHAADQADNQAGQRPDKRHRQFGFRVRHSLLHGCNAAEDHEGDTVDLDPFIPGNQRVGEFVHKHTSKKAECDDGAEQIGNIAGADKGSVYRYLEDLVEHTGRERDLAPDNPGKQGNDQDKCIMDQDWNSKNAPDPKRPVHNKGLSF